MFAALKTWRRDPWMWMALAALVLGAGVRLWRIDFELPEVTDVDAGKYVEPAQHIAQTGDLKPYDFQYPGGYINVLALLYASCGIDGSYGQHLTARLVSAAGGVAMIVATWLLARRLAGSFAACLAAALTAVSVECVTWSRVAATDTWTASWVTLALAMAIAPRPTWRTWALAGAFTGLAAGTKFSGACVGPFVVLAALINGWRARRPAEAARGAGLTLLAMIVAFWLTTPRFPFDFHEYRDRLALEANIQRFGQFGHVQYGWWDYLFSSVATPEQPWLYTSLVWNVGPMVLLLMAVALVAALAGRGGPPGVIVALYVLGYAAIITGQGHLKATRFLLLVLPALFALAGGGAERLLLKVASIFSTKAAMAPDVSREKVPMVAAAMLVAVALAWPAYRSGRYLTLFTERSTNVLMRDWVNENLPAGTKVFASPFYVSDLWGLPLQPMTFTDAWQQQYRLPESVGPSAEREPLYVPQLVDVCRQNEIGYIVLNSYFEDGLAPTLENMRWFPRSVAAYAAFRLALAATADEVYKVEGYTAGRMGPDVTIYRLRP